MRNIRPLMSVAVVAIAAAIAALILVWLGDRLIVMDVRTVSPTPAQKQIPIPEKVETAASGDADDFTSIVAEMPDEPGFARALALAGSAGIKWAYVAGLVVVLILLAIFGAFRWRDPQHARLLFLFSVLLLALGPIALQMMLYGAYPDPNRAYDSLYVFTMTAHSRKLIVLTARLGIAGASVAAVTAGLAWLMERKGTASQQVPGPL